MYMYKHVYAIRSQLGEVNWSVAAATFPITVQLLALPEYAYHTLLGVAASCGGLSESTVIIICVLL